MNRYAVTPLLFRIIFIIPIFFFYLTGQSGTSGNDLFFLDLGIVIEPSTGNEEVNRLIKAPPEKVSFFIDKAPSGSVFIATTKELQETLRRIGKRIEILEHAFQEEVSSLKEENKELRNMIGDLLEREPVLPLQAVTPVPSQEEYSSPSIDLPVRVIQEEKKAFNRMLYMNAVFAYQREDYDTALRHFSKLYLGAIDQVTAGNVLYWFADCYYQLRAYGDALNTLAAIRPLFNSDKQDDAMVLTGLVYREMGYEIGAIEAFTHIVNDYPDSEYFKLAQMELRKAER